jgi:hypothetical protein
VKPEKNKKTVYMLMNRLQYNEGRHDKSLQNVSNSTFTVFQKVKRKDLLHLTLLLCHTVNEEVSRRKSLM